MSVSLSVEIISQCTHKWKNHILNFSSVQSLSHVWLCNPMNRSMPGLPVHHQLRVHSDSCSSSHPAISSSVVPFSSCPPIPPSIRVFSNNSTLHMRWPKYWSFSFGITPSKEYPGLISFRMDWLDLLAVQGTLKSLLQHHSSKPSILWCSAFFMLILCQIDTWLANILSQFIVYLFITFTEFLIQ